MIKRFLFLLCFLGVLIGNTAQTCAEEENPVLVFDLAVSTGYVQLYTENIDGEQWLFLPSFAQPEDLSIQGHELTWGSLEADEDGLWYVDVIHAENVQEVSVMRSANLRAMFLFSDDPVEQGRSFVEDMSTKHENETSASLILVDADGKVNHSEHIEKLRGRGNGTWGCPKRSYQMKLDYQANLLDTGERANQAKKWLLMADQVDETMLHYQISMDMARELGLCAMETEFIDLYYDGCYRGLYRLCEKVEVGEGRLDIVDYDHLLKKWNNKVGQYDLELLTGAEGVNRFGNHYTYVEGVIEDRRPDVGAYVIEMESRIFTLSDRCYFTLRDGGEIVYALKNPENATQQMMTFISERLQHAQDTLRNGGVNPETGALASEEFDLDAFARTLLVHELARNLDGYTYSSSFFILPAGEGRFIPGPVWDLDLAYRWVTGRCDGTVGFKDEKGWLTDFYRVPEFAEIVLNIYQQELYPLIKNVLLGQNHGVYLKPLYEYAEWIAASDRMDEMIWDGIHDGRMHYADSFEDEIRLLYSFLDQRSKWMNEAYQALHTADENHLPLWMVLRYANPDDSHSFVSFPWEEVEVQVISAQQISEADENTYALWEVEALITANAGRTLDGYTVSLNGTMMDTELQEDGSLLIRARYADESYLPADYYGEDIGLIYQYDRYIELYPHVAEALDYDEQAVMDYFFEEGIYEGQVGNGFFDPKYVAKLVPHIEDYLYDEWSLYYWEYMDWGAEADWLNESVFGFLPEIINTP